MTPDSAGKGLPRASEAPEMPETAPAPAGDSAPLTASQELFCQQYLVDLNATQAYHRAYPDASLPSCEAAGSRLLGNVRVAARIAELQAARAARLEVTQDWVLRSLVSVAERCMQAEPVRGRDGKPIEGEYQFEHSGANRALELIGKNLGMFKEKLELTMPPDEAAAEVAALLDTARRRAAAVSRN